MAGRRVVFIGGADELRLTEGGTVHHPGDIVSISDMQRASLSASGHRFGVVPDEPEPLAAPEPPPALEPASVSASVMPPRTVPPTAAPAPASGEKPKEERT